MVTPSELFTRGHSKALLVIDFGCLGKQARRQPVVTPSELFTKGLSKALEKVYASELEHINEYWEAASKLGK